MSAAKSLSSSLCLLASFTMDFSVFSNPRLKNGKGYGVVVSALSKSIRRGRVEEAMWCANALFDTFSAEPTDPSHRKTFVNYR